MNLTRVMLCASGLACACTNNPDILPPNKMPQAEAGPDQFVNFAGAPVDVVLDGTRSSDSDGQLIEYRWLSATRPPGGGSGRYVPPGELLDWPTDGAWTTVRLPEGVWLFSLQVTDSGLATSLPDTVQINVGVGEAPAGMAGTGGAAAFGSGAAGAGGAGAGGASAGAGGAGAGGASAGAGGAGGMSGAGGA